MRKLKLDLDQLEVTSFETDDRPGERGTVAGFLHRPLDTDRTCGNWQDTCDAGQYTCWASCIADQCGPTPNGACGGTASCPLD